MKNLLKIITLVLITLFVSTSCQDDETNWDELTKSSDVNAKYYVQFLDASKTLQSGVNTDGSLKDINTKIKVKLLGLPQSKDIVVNYSVDASSTISANMYELSSNSITIPAGKTVGEIDLKTNTLLMPAGQTLNLVLNIEGAEKATAGTKLVYKLERINFCLKTLSDYVGTWTGKDSWDYNTQITTSINSDGKLVMNGIGFGWFQDWWGEIIVVNNPVIVDINLVTGEFKIDETKQTSSYLESTYNGAPQDPYKIKATGKITSTCDRKIEFEYSFIQGGSAFNGSAWGPKFKEVITPN